MLGERGLLGQFEVRRRSSAARHSASIYWSTARSVSCPATAGLRGAQKTDRETISLIAVAMKKYATLPTDATEHIYFSETEKKSHVKPLAHNYFGLPIHAVSQTAGGLVYRGRKPVPNLFEDDEELNAARRERNQVVEQSTSNQQEEKHAKKDNFVAQRKVASALLAIATNPATVTHFAQQGGMDAVFKMAFDTSDPDTLTICSKCVSQAAYTPQNRKIMVDKQVTI
jgi:hypothetical protein